MAHDDIVLRRQARAKRDRALSMSLGGEPFILFYFQTIIAHSRRPLRAVNSCFFQNKEKSSEKRATQISPAHASLSPATSKLSPWISFHANGVS